MNYDTIKTGKYDEGFEFSSRYSYYKRPQTSPYAFIALRDVLDSADNARFPEGAYGRATQNNAERVKKIESECKEATRPGVIVTPDPALDDHTDHQYTTIALLQALEALQDHRATLLLYTNHHVLSEHYPYGPSIAAVTLPPWFGGTRFAGLLSYRLDESVQLRKLFALEAMHDLRAPPLRLLTGALTGVLWERLKQATELVRHDPFGDYSYFRRAVRPNELFFVYPPEARPAATDFVAPLKR